MEQKEDSSSNRDYNIHYKRTLFLHDLERFTCACLQLLQHWSISSTRCGHLRLHVQVHFTVFEFWILMNAPFYGPLSVDSSQPASRGHKWSAAVSVCTLDTCSRDVHPAESTLLSKWSPSMMLCFTLSVLDLLCWRGLHVVPHHLETKVRGVTCSLLHPNFTWNSGDLHRPNFSNSLF